MGSPGSAPGRAVGRRNRARCALPPDAIAWYEQLFFAVRACRKAEKYLLWRTVGDGVQRGFLDHEVGNFWAWLALGGGTVALDAMIQTFHAARQPGEPAAMGIYLCPGVAPKIQGFVASMVLPQYGVAGEAWREIRLQLMEADATVDQDRRALLRERAEDYLIACARNYLAGKPLPRVKRWSQKTKDRASKPTGVSSGRRRKGSPEAAARDTAGSAVSAESPLAERPRRRWRSVAASGLTPTARGAGCKWASSDGSSLVT